MSSLGFNFAVTGYFCAQLITALFRSEVAKNKIERERKIDARVLKSWPGQLSN